MQTSRFSCDSICVVGEQPLGRSAIEETEEDRRQQVAYALLKRPQGLGVTVRLATFEHSPRASDAGARIASNRKPRNDPAAGSYWPTTCRGC